MINFLENIKGIIVTPGQTLGELMDKKQWVTSFILIIIAILILTYISAPFDIAKGSELIKNSSFAEHFSEDQIENFGHISSLNRIMASIWASFISILVLIVASFFIYLFYGIGKAEGLYINYFSLVTNASIIDMLIPKLIRTSSLLFLNTNIAAYSNLSILFPAHTSYSLSLLVFSQIDIFSIWYLIAIATGIAVFSKMSFKKSIFIAILYFLFKSITKILFSYMFIRVMGS